MIQRIITKLYIWSDRVHFPIYLALVYVVGVFMMHFLWPNYPGFFIEYLFVLCELSILKLVYENESDYASGIKAHITVSPFIWITLFLLNPVYNKLWNNPVITIQGTVQGCRTITIVADMVYVVYCFIVRHLGSIRNWIHKG